MRWMGAGVEGEEVVAYSLVTLGLATPRTPRSAFACYYSLAS
jgi:hypothetical protein